MFPSKTAIFSGSVGLVNQYSLDFDGSNDYVAISDNAGITDYPLTLAGWAKTSTTAAGTIIGFTDASATGTRILLLTGRGGSSNNASAFADAAGAEAIGTSNVCDGNWHHIVGVYTSSTSRSIYVDGALETTDTTSFSFAAGLDVFGIGRSSDSTPSAYLNGNIDEVAIWDVALDADAVAAIYNSGTPIALDADDGNYDNSGDLQGWWRMGEGTNEKHEPDYIALEVSDMSANSNDGSPVNMALNDFVTDVP